MSLCPCWTLTSFGVINPNAWFNLVIYVANEAQALLLVFYISCVMTAPICWVSVFTIS